MKPPAATVTRTTAPAWVGFVNRLVPAVDFGEQSVRRAAERAAAAPLDHAIDAPLAALLADFAASPTTGVAAHVRYAMLVDALAGRARVLAGADPGFPVDPIVIVGLHRSGTTLLHHLLAVGARAPRYWELASPVGAPAWARVTARASLLAHRALAPEMRHVHPVAAEDPEECWPLLMRSLASVSLDLHADVPRWRAWWAAADLVPAYQFLARQLGQITARTAPGPRASDARFVLKCPEHLWALDALHAVFPDARLVWAHRDPAACVPSYCALSALQRRVFDGHFAPEEVGAHVLDRLADGVARGARARARAGWPTGAIVDVRYDDLVRAPVDTVIGVNNALGRASDRDALATWLARHPPHARSPHRYDPAFFGLSPDAIRARFPSEEATWT